MDDSNYNYESVNRASKACGPLVKWAIAQVSICSSWSIYGNCIFYSLVCIVWQQSLVESSGDFLLLFSHFVYVFVLSCISLSRFLQLNYSEMLKRVDPLRNELRDLENRAETTRIKGEEMKRIVFELEESITKYKEEYALLISDANAIKSDLSTVEAKVGE